MLALRLLCAWQIFACSATPLAHSAWQAKPAHAAPRARLVSLNTLLNIHLSTLNISLTLAIHHQ